MLQLISAWVRRRIFWRRPLHGGSRAASGPATRRVAPGPSTSSASRFTATARAPRSPGSTSPGVHFLRKRKSSLLIGVGEDARDRGRADREARRGNRVEQAERRWPRSGRRRRRPGDQQRALETADDRPRLVVRAAGRRSEPLACPPPARATSHVSFSSKKRTIASRIGCGQRLVLGGEHPAQAHALGRAARPRRSRRRRRAWRGRRPPASISLERRGEALRVALDQRLAELGLPGEVVVQAGLGDAELVRDVGVAEAVEAARLHEPLGDVEDRGGVSESPRARAPRILA